MKSPIRSLAHAAAGLVICLLASCAGNTDSASMTPLNAVASSRTGLPVTATVSGGGPSSGVLANVPDEDFKEALESSLVKSGLFSNAGGGGYQIEAFVASLKQPAFGLSMAVQLEVSYTLKKGGATLWSKSIQSEYTAPVGEAFVGAVRLRKATEGAVRENIALLIRSLDQKL